jgi:sporulation protein YlmC with PRC-barrel domain
MLKLEEIVGLEVISSDAMIVGAVEGIGIDVNNWRVPALRVGLKKGVEAKVGKGKPVFSSTRVMVKTSSVENISDAVTMMDSVNQLPNAFIEEEDMLTAADLLGKRVITKGAKQLGVIDNLVIEPEHDWGISFIQVKLDKASLDTLNMRKSMLSSTPVIRLQTRDVRTVGDMVMLRISVEEIKDYLERRPKKESKEAMPVSEGLTL